MAPLEQLAALTVRALVALIIICAHALKAAAIIARLVVLYFVFVNTKSLAKSLGLPLETMHQQVLIPLALTLLAALFLALPELLATMRELRKPLPPVPGPDHHFEDDDVTSSPQVASQMKRHQDEFDWLVPGTADYIAFHGKPYKDD